LNNHSRNLVLAQDGHVLEQVGIGLEESTIHKIVLNGLKQKGAE
jgi:hypothetical protein